jgi:hypothetical protein
VAFPAAEDLALAEAVFPAVQGPEEEREGAEEPGEPEGLQGVEADYLP